MLPEFSGQQMLAFGINTTKGARESEMDASLRSVVLRGEDHSAVARRALTRRTLEAYIHALPHFMNPTGSVLVQRINEICLDDEECQKAALKKIRASTEAEERHTKRMVERTSTLRERLLRTKTDNPKLRECINALPQIPM
jgi:hypothetical protein